MLYPPVNDCLVDLGGTWGMTFWQGETRVRRQEVVLLAFGFSDGGDDDVGGGGGGHRLVIRPWHLLRRSSEASTLLPLHLIFFLEP
jgi:hypothetical protein